MAPKSINDLPEGMISEILLRLPVKSLLQCKSVCKPWLSLISTPHFIKSQLLGAITASINTPTLLIIKRPPPTEEELARTRAAEAKAAEIFRNFTWTSPALEPQHQRRLHLIEQALLDPQARDLSSSPVQFDSLVMPPLLFARYGINGVCNGIVCLANLFGNNIYLWNPSIGKCKKLPAPKPYTATTLPVKVGFGYDPVSDDYKVFRVVSEKDFDVEPLIQVYSSNADSWTTEFKAPVLKNIRLYGKANVVVDGVLYFGSHRDHLISFDLHKEIFGLVPFPRFTTRNVSDVLDFRGSVAMVFQSGTDSDLWTLDNVSGEVSWTKKFSIEVDSETEIRLTYYLGAAQFVGYKLFDGISFMFSVLYDYQKKETKIYKYGEKNEYAYLKYTQTLVSLDGFEQVQ